MLYSSSLRVISNRKLYLIGTYKRLKLEIGIFKMIAWGKRIHKNINILLEILMKIFTQQNCIIEKSLEGLLYIMHFNFV